MIDVDALTDEDIEEITEEHEWEQDPEPELEEFSGHCPFCGAEMEKLEYSYKGGCEIAQYMCMRCGEEDAQRGRVWVYEDGPYEGCIVEDM